MTHPRKQEVIEDPCEAEDHPVTVLLANGHCLLHRALEKMFSSSASMEVVGKAEHEGKPWPRPGDEPDVVVLGIEELLMSIFVNVFTYR